jgi:3alpha(or 20beta)-hydroxysteroid dehydrogenase
MGKLDGRVAIVTGAARGLGAASAMALCADGAEVVITDILTELGEETVENLRSRGFAAHFAALDVREEAQWAAVVAETLERSGRIDCLVNNAGISLPRTIEDLTVAEIRRVFDINLIGAVLGMQAVIPTMKAQKSGSIINISSNSTRKIVSLASVYSASKAALANIGKTAAVHCAQEGYGIRINSIHPGPHATDMLLSGPQDADLPEVRRMIDSIPMGRMGEPSDVAGVVAFLASDASRYMTAAEIFVDGGVTVV